MSSLFSQHTLSQADVSANAAFQVKGYEQMLSLRIALQKVLDEGNKFPVRELHASETNDGAYTHLTNSIQTCLRNVTGLLTAKCQEREMREMEERKDARRATTAAAAAAAAVAAEATKRHHGKK